MTREDLSWLGFEYLLRRKFFETQTRRTGKAAAAAILTAFVRRPGVPQNRYRLADAADISDKSFGVVLTTIRNNLRDMGIKATIDHAGAQATYVLSREGADEIIDRVFEGSGLTEIAA